MGKWSCDNSLNYNEVPDIHVKTACELEKLISHKCGSNRRRVQDTKEDRFEDTNSMKKRLEGDDWIE